MTTPEHYRALKERAAIGAVAPRKAIGVTGKDRAAYLHGLLTNDIQALTPGTGCYAAWLTPQGRMPHGHTHLRIRRDDPAGCACGRPACHFATTGSTSVQRRRSACGPVGDVEGGVGSRATVSSMLEQVLTGVAEPASWLEYQNTRAEFGGSPVVVARVSQLGVPGFVVYIEPARQPDLQRALVERGAIVAEPAAIEVARIEAGYPLFGVDMTEETIPLEAGIEDRAISLSKGCYVGQEVIVRVLHRGHGRIAKKLVTLHMHGEQSQEVPARGARLFSEARDVGWVTSAASSPQLGPIALGYVHRDFVAAGTRLEVETGSGRVAAVVTERSISSATL